MKNPVLKGKLTAISTALFALAQTPNLVGDLIGAPDTFTRAAEQPLNIVSLVAACGIIYGAIRRAWGYFGK